MLPTPITIIGAGLAGSLLGILLAERGFRPTVYERRPDMRRERQAAGRSINLALADRGMHALEQAGLLDVVRPLMIPMRGRMIHDLDGSSALLPYGQNDREVIYSVSRAELNKLLMSELERRSGNAIRFRQACRGADFSAGVLTMFDEARGSTYALGGGPVIATDGAASAVRDAMVRAGLAQAREDILTHAYKELTITAGFAGVHRIEKHALHIWPRGGYMLIALPNLDGSFTVTLFLAATGPESFAALHSGEALQQFFETRFPDVAKLIPDLKRDFFANPTGNMVTVHCAPWHVGGQALLCGDAAHAIVPFHGQGMNCAFEDCLALATLAGSHADWETMFADFERRRRLNTDAIAAMTLENYVEMRDTVRDPKFQLQKELSLELERRFPQQFVPRYSMVMFHHEIPYAMALARGQIQQSILDELTSAAQTIEEIDMQRAAELVQAKLEPLR